MRAAGNPRMQGDPARVPAHDFNHQNICDYVKQREGYGKRLGRPKGAKRLRGSSRKSVIYGLFHFWEGFCHRRKLESTPSAHIAQEEYPPEFPALEQDAIPPGTILDSRTTDPKLSWRRRP